MLTRSYSELVLLKTFEQRYRYLALNGVVGDSTFGHDRYLNQMFYRSREWRQLRHKIIARDEGLDLGVSEHEIYDAIYVHHMNPMVVSDIADGNDDILNPEFLISVSLRTHNAIHYGDERLLAKPLVERRPGDTKLW